MVIRSHPKPPQCDFKATHKPVDMVYVWRTDGVRMEYAWCTDIVRKVYGWCTASVDSLLIGRGSWAEGALAGGRQVAAPAAPDEEMDGFGEELYGVFEAPVRIRSGARGGAMKIDGAGPLSAPLPETIEDNWRAYRAKASLKRR